MFRETLGIVLAVLVGIMSLALWLADKAGKNSPGLTVCVLIFMALLALCAVYLIPWLRTTSIVGDNFEIFFSNRNSPAGSWSFRHLGMAAASARSQSDCTASTASSRVQHRKK
jgi:hypothetical protein